MALLGLVAFPLGWGYWFIQRDKNRQVSDWMAAPTAVLVFLVSASIVTRQWTWPPQGCGRVVCLVFLGDAVSGVGGVGPVLLLAKRQPEAQGEVFTRAKMSQWLAVTLLTAFVSAAFALIDSFGQVIAMWLREGVQSPMFKGGGLAATIGALIAATSKLSPLLSSGTGGKRLSLPRSVVAGIAATVVPRRHPGLPRHHDPLLVSRIGDARCMADGRSGRAVAALRSYMRFVNSSSHQAMYADRLIRAYLGASNPRRFLI